VKLNKIKEFNSFVQGIYDETQKKIEEGKKKENDKLE
jgi:hypothetical protein